MQPNILGTKVVTQVGLIVRNVEETARKYAEFFGVPMPEIMVSDPLEKAQTIYRGKPSEARAKLAFFKVGETLDIELIEPDGKPSTWQEFLDTHGEGVHHIAFNVEGMKEKVALLQTNGIAEIMKGEFTGGRYSYVDTASSLKTIIELLEFDRN